MSTEKTEAVQHDNIYAALSALQGELKSVKRSKEVTVKTKTGGEYKFMYAPLDEIFELIYPLLVKNGLSVQHKLHTDGLECIVTHNSSKKRERSTGEIRDVGGLRSYMTETVTEDQISSGILPINRTGSMQDIGGQITYARRYTLTMALGIASEEDTDAKLLPERTEKLEKFAFGTAKTAIEKLTTEKEVNEKIAFFQKELALIEKKKTPSLGLTEDQYRELVMLAEQKKAELKESINADQ